MNNFTFNRLYLLLKKIGFLFFSLFVIASLTFFLMKSIPGDPFSEDQAMKKEAMHSLRSHHGLDLPLWTQYTEYLNQLLHGQLGYSLKFQQKSINQIILEGFDVSAKLGLQAFILAVVMGISLGIISALWTNRWPDSFILTWTALHLSIPSFLLAAFLQYLFSIHFPIFPLGRWGTFSQTILPSLALAATPMAFIARLMRTQFLKILQTDYIKLAKAKGLPTSHWFFRHALKNALLPILGYLGQLFTNILIGSFVIEKIFNIPGLGQWFIDSVSNRDYPLIMGLTLFYSLILLTITFLIDLLYQLLDPRVQS